MPTLPVGGNPERKRKSSGIAAPVVLTTIGAQKLGVKNYLRRSKPASGGSK